MAILTSRGVKASHQLKGVRKVRISRDRRGAGEVKESSYSTEEQRLDKMWIDGKPIYEKTYYLAGPFSTTHTFTVTNLKRIVNVSGFYTYDTTKFTTIPFASFGMNASYGIKDFNPTTGVVTLEPRNTTVKDVYITVQYTKTTDD